MWNFLFYILFFLFFVKRVVARVFLYICCAGSKKRERHSSSLIPLLYSWNARRSFVREREWAAKTIKQISLCWKRSVVLCCVYPSLAAQECSAYRVTCISLIYLSLVGWIKNCDGKKNRCLYSFHFSLSCIFAVSRNFLLFGYSRLNIILVHIQKKKNAYVREARRSNSNIKWKKKKLAESKYIGSWRNERCNAVMAKPIYTYIHTLIPHIAAGRCQPSEYIWPPCKVEPHKRKACPRIQMNIARLWARKHVCHFSLYTHRARPVKSNSVDRKSLKIIERVFSLVYILV